MWPLRKISGIEETLRATPPSLLGTAENAKPFEPANARLLEVSAEDSADTADSGGDYGIGTLDSADESDCLDCVNDETDYKDPTDFPDSFDFSDDEDPSDHSDPGPDPYE
jgi:hypothetical protein